MRHVASTFYNADTGGPAWQDVCCDEGDDLERIEVPGGWLYRVVLDPSLQMHPKGTSLAVAMTFVPKPHP